ncbi:MAG: CopG family ribbon-helix-helix protein [Candidatus Micrarchaeia archaeon]|jgi:CopG family nickel-responsive transcriptional regulator
MAIISASIDDETLSELDSLCKTLLFSGRSEAIRAGIRSLAAENKSAEGLSGEMKAVLLLVHQENAEKGASSLAHEFEDVVSTHIHSNLRREKCLEIFVLAGDSGRIRGLFRAAKGSKKMEYARLVVP